VSCFSALTAQHLAVEAANATEWDALALPPAWSSTKPKATGGSVAKHIHLLDAEDLGTLRADTTLAIENDSLVASDGAIVVAATGPSMLRNLIGIGCVVYQKVDNIVTYTVDPQKLNWIAPQRLLHGTTPLYSGLRMHPMYHPKLAIILDLCRNGWRFAGDPRPRCLKPGDKVFWCDFNKSKYYFIAMLDSAIIFGNMRTAGIRPQIMHDMTHNYYMGLVKLSGVAELKALIAMAERNANDQEFHTLLKSNGVAVEEVVPAIQAAPIAAVSVDANDSIIEQVLGGLPELMVDISSTIKIEFPSADDMAIHLLRDRSVIGGRGKGKGRGKGRGRKGRGGVPPVPKLCVQVHFDNACHPSGKQRGFIACCRRDHGHCVKWKNVELCTSNVRLVGELTAWSMLAASQGAAYTKEDHIKDWPSEDQILHYVNLVPTDPAV
jgi:hypothetical protein